MYGVSFHLVPIVTNLGLIASRLGIPGQYDSELFHSTVARIAAAAEKASHSDSQVFVGLGGLEPRPDLLETFAKRHNSIRCVFANGC